ncbi:hypothetical protein AKO1_012299 [Acrasis kona]|uniref:ER membrane protein complex subunit 8/9 homolog n=1 Tax=Acrasis kona TaxID=1008807 RepID=A0AAW2YWS9_9EUKA
MVGLGVKSSAYQKVVLHACKYPYCDVNGVLIGYEEPENGLIITDAIPLFHGHLTLLPLLEAALLQIDSLLEIRNKSSQKLLQIVGYYFANEVMENESISAIHTSIFNKIAKNFPGSTLWRVDNKLLATLSNKSAVVVYNQNEKSKRFDKKEQGINYFFASSQADQVDPIEVFDTLSKKIQKEEFLTLFDFEDHVDDVTKSYENKNF